MDGICGYFTSHNIRSLFLSEEGQKADGGIDLKIIDMHCDTICEIFESRKRNEEALLRENHLMVDLQKMRTGGYSVQNFALFVEQKDGENLFAKAEELLKVFKEEMNKNKDVISQVYDTKDILKNESAGRLSALLTVEEGAVCEGRLDRLHYFYEQGVRMMTLTWNYPNELGFPNFRENQSFFTPNAEEGLTKTGIEFIHEMERIGMIIDVSHLSDAGFYDVMKHTKIPFVASHSNARAVCPWVRNLTDDMIFRLAERGGVIGLNYCADFLRNRLNGTTKAMRPTEGGFATLTDIAMHAKHMANVGGIECVGLGSDFDGIPPHPELSNAAELPKLADTLLKNGFHESEVDKILYQNVFRLYREILG